MATRKATPEELYGGYLRLMGAQQHSIDDGLRMFRDADKKFQEAIVDLAAACSELGFGYNDFSGFLMALDAAYFRSSQKITLRTPPKDGVDRANKRIWIMSKIKKYIEATGNQVSISNLSFQNNQLVISYTDNRPKERTPIPT